MFIALELTGTTPLVQHNVRLADKEDPLTEEIAGFTKKRKKTADDEQQIARLEFLAGLYHDTDLGVYVPAWNIVRALEDGARITRQGADVVRALAVLADRVPLAYTGPRKPSDLWEDKTFRLRKIVGVQRAKVMRTRPIFRHWSLRMEADLLESVLDPDDFRRIAEQAGRAVGLGDARKLGFGRFGAVVQVVEEAAA